MIPALGRCRLTDLFEFEARLVYISSSRPVRTQTLSKNKNKNSILKKWNRACGCSKQEQVYNEGQVLISSTKKKKKPTKFGKITDLLKKMIITLIESCFLNHLQVNC